MVKSETQSVSLRSSPFLGQMATRAACWSRGTLEQGWFSPEQSRESLGSDDDDAWLGFLKMSAISLGSHCVRGGKDLVTLGVGHRGAWCGRSMGNSCKEEDRRVGCFRFRKYLKAKVRSFIL